MNSRATRRTVAGTRSWGLPVGCCGSAWPTPGLTADDVYVTNAVKHFKHEVHGTRRLHKKPTAAEVDACHPWLEAELRAVRANAVVALGATAARSLMGRNVPIAASRDRRFEVAGHLVLVTYHPSAVLRADERAAEIRRALVDDLRRAGELAAATSSGDDVRV